VGAHEHTHTLRGIEGDTPNIEHVIAHVLGGVADEMVRLSWVFLSFDSSL
jgi:hypothetical protein